MRDFSERQSRLFFLIVSFLVRYEPPELQPLVDEDVTEAMAALAATFETASKGVIYEHRPASLSAERLVTSLKPLLAEAGGPGVTGFDRDAAVVLRRVEGAAREVGRRAGGGRRVFVELAGRVVGRETEAEAPDRTPPQIIVP